MKKNYEIKCKLANYKKIKELAGSLKKLSYSVEKQVDIYYKVKSGRLKLRIINDKEANLIYYNRAERSNKRISQYIISKTNDFKELDGILRNEFKILISVTKIREIYFNKTIRIHLDRVKKLGNFLEIEIIYVNLTKAKKEMKELIHFLKLNENTFIKNSYSDLLINKK